MGRRLRRLSAEIAKFLAVGGVATAVALVIFNGLVHGYFGDPGGPMRNQPLVAFVLANTVGMVVSYRGSRSWAFQHREAVGAADGRVAYFVINTLSMAIPLACLTFSRYVLDRADPVADNIAANVVGLGLGTAARFWAIRQFIFLHPLKAAQLREKAASRS
jgi:putative flippase GtrA